MLLVEKRLEIPQAKLSLGHCIDMNAVRVTGKPGSINKVAVSLLKSKLFQLLIDKHIFGTILSKT